MRISRREMLAAMGAAVAGAGVAVAAPAVPAFVQSRPLRIGALISRMDRQGQDELIQPYDRQMRLGLELAIAEINDAGGILGRQVELLVADDEGSPAPGGAAAAAIDLIRNEGVEALVTGFVMAMPPYMDRTPRARGPGRPGGSCHADPRGTYCGARGARRLDDAPGDSRRCWSTAARRPGGARSRSPTGAPSQRTVSNQFYRHVQAGSTGAALVTTPVRGNSPGEYTGLVAVGARTLDARNFWISIPRPYAVNVVTQARLARRCVRFRLALPGVQRVAGGAAPPTASRPGRRCPSSRARTAPGVRDFVARAPAGTRRTI